MATEKPFRQLSGELMVITNVIKGYGFLSFFNVVCERRYIATASKALNNLSKGIGTRQSK